jgi:hypothetical protein
MKNNMEKRKLFVGHILAMKKVNLCVNRFFYERSSIEILSDLILPKKYKLGLREIFF